MSFIRQSGSSYGAEVSGYDAGLRSYMLGVYNYMASALALTGVVALFAASSNAFMSVLYQIGADGRIVGMTGLGMVAAFAPLAFVLALSFGINKMRVSTVQTVFFAYAAVMGISMSSIFLVYTGTSIARVFFITAGMFGAMSLYGYTTKRDLSGFGSFLMMGLIGVILASVVNIFLASSALGFALSIAGTLIFVGLTAYDTQSIKQMYWMVAGDGEAAAKSSVMGALRLYLDFINMFYYMLHFFGDRK